MEGNTIIFQIEDGHLTTYDEQAIQNDLLSMDK